MSLQARVAMREVVLASLRAWIDHRGDSKGAALAFYALFSTAPILVLAVAGASRFFGPEAARGEILALVASLAGTQGANAIEGLIAGARDPAAGLAATMVAAVILLLAAAAVFVELKGSFDEIWGHGPPRGGMVAAFLRTQLHAFGLVLLLGFVLLAALGFGAALEVLERRAGGGMPLASWSISLAMVASFVAVLYKVLPDAPLTWLDAWIGAAFAALLFIAGRVAIGAYLASGELASRFGAGGSLIAFLLWVYYCSQILFLGAEFTRQHALGRGSLREDDAGGPGDSEQPHRGGPMPSAAARERRENEKKATGVPPGIATSDGGLRGLRRSSKGPAARGAAA